MIISLISRFEISKNVEMSLNDTAVYIVFLTVYNYGYAIHPSNQLYILQLFDNLVSVQ